MLDFFKTLFKPAPPSSTTAKERLRLVLLSDHLSLAPDVVESLKRDLLEVISRYVEIDPRLADVSFEQRDSEVAMLANIPITGVRERGRPVAPVYTPTATTAPVATPVPEARPAPLEPTATEDELEPEALPSPALPGMVDEQGEPRARLQAEATQQAAASAVPVKPRRRRRRNKKAPVNVTISQPTGLATGSI